VTVPNPLINYVAKNTVHALPTSSMALVCPACRADQADQTSPRTRQAQRGRSHEEVTLRLGRYLTHVPADRGSLAPPRPLARPRTPLGHASIQTTGDIYADWDIDQLTATMADVLAADEDDETPDSQSFPRPRRKNSRFAAETRNQWRRWESNPRPQSRENGFYERSRRSDLIPHSPRRRGWGEPAS
jgi:hypothetical protein